MRKRIRMASWLLVFLMVLPVFAGAEEAAETDWYRQRADAMAAELTELMDSGEYLDLMGLTDECLELIDAWREAAEEGPVQTGLYESSVGLLLPAFGMAEGLPEAAVERLRQMAGTMAFSLANGQRGTEFLAASAVLTVTDYFLLPEGFEECIILYEYDDFCIGVSFIRGSEAVVAAQATVVPEEVKKLMLKKGAEADVQTGIRIPEGFAAGGQSADGDDRAELRGGRPGMGAGKRGK